MWNICHQSTLYPFRFEFEAILISIYFQFEVAVITKDGVVIEPAISSDTNWEIAPMVK